MYKKINLFMQKNTPWLSVPQFGDWDQKGQVPDYSLDFSKIRETRKQNKRDISRASLGNDEELIASTTTTTNNDANTHTDANTHSDDHHHDNHYDQGQHSPTVRFLAIALVLLYFVTLFNNVSSTTRQHVVVGSYKGDRNIIYNKYDGVMHVVGC
jgi:hypothetical protein